MKDYVARYDAATRRVLENGAKIDRFAMPIINAPYSLYKIASVLRQKYKDHLFRDKYVGDMQFEGFTPYPKGFCALSSICVYELYGGADIWVPSAIHMGDWEHAPVVSWRGGQPPDWENAYPEQRSLYSTNQTRIGQALNAKAGTICKARYSL